MISVEHRERWSTKNVMLVTFLFSILLILVAFLLDDEFSEYKNIIISVACSILASNIIMYFTSEFMIRSRRRSEIIDRWGLESIYRTRSEMNVSSNKSLELCKRKIDICAIGLKSFRDAKGDELERLLREGVSVRIITLSKESIYLEKLDERENLAHGQTRKEVFDLFDFVESLKNKNTKGSIEIKGYDFLPLDFYLRIDGRIFIGPYIKGKSSQQVISYEFTSGEGFNYWDSYFENIWTSLE